MSDQFDFSAVFNFAIKGANAVKADARGLTGALDEMYKAGQLTDKQYERLSKSAIAAGNATQNAAGGLDKATRSSASLQYGINQAAGTLAVAGAAMIGFGVAATTTAIKFESDFAQVARTSGLVGDELADLRAGLIDLTQNTPTSFADIAGIASLGAQLGIAGKDLESFTGTVARLTTASDLTVEAAGTAIARVGQLTGVTADQYENLGSSIALVGVESIATESQITRTANNIASIGNFAGLSAADIIGLSGALASLGVPPELSRGTLERFFTQVGKAADGGGEDLANFGRISGMSGEEFANSFKPGAPAGAAAGAFTAFLKGLGQEGDNARSSLRDLGITSVRDVPTLLKLSQSADVVAQSFATANKGFDEGTELQRQYNIIAETTGAKLQQLGNNFQVFLDAIGSQSTGILNSAIDGLITLLQTLTDLSNVKPLEGIGIGLSGADLLAVGAGLTALLGVLALVAAGAGRALTGILALREAFNLLAPAALRAGAASEFAGAGFTMAGNSANVSSRSVQLMGRALDIASKAALAFIAVDLGNKIGKIGTDFLGITPKVDDAVKALSGGELAAYASNYNNFFSGLDRGIQDATKGFVFFSTNAARIKMVDDALTELVAGGNTEAAAKLFAETTAGADKAGISTQRLAELFPQYSAAVGEASGANKENAASSAAALEAQKQVEEQIQATEDAFKAVYDALKQYNDALYNNADAQAGFYQAIDDGNQAVYDAGVKVLEASGQYKDLEGNVIASEAAIRSAGKASLTAAGEFDITTQSGRDADAQLRSLAQAGNGAAAELFNTGETADVVSAKLNENEAAVRKLGEEYGLSGTALDNFVNKYVKSPKDFDYDLQVNGISAAEAALNRVARDRTATIRVYETYAQNPIRTGDYGNGLGVLKGKGYADGGYTGRGGKYSPAGIVHRGEYVVPKKFVNQSTGMPYADALNRLSRGTAAPTGYAGGGFVSGGIDGSVVELGPKSLRAVANQAATVLLDSGVLARAVNNSNANSAYRGGGR